MNAHMILKAALLVGFSLLVLTMMSPTETSQANYPTVGLAAPDCPPKIDISKQEEGPDIRYFLSGTDVPFEITVTNTGNLDLSNVLVTDTEVADCNRQIGSLPVGGPPYIYTCEAPNVTQSFNNIAAVQGEANGMTVYDKDPSEVLVKRDVKEYDITIGFEDWRINSDYDYNDWVVSIDTNIMGAYDIDEDTVRLEKITFNMTPQARGAEFGHEFHLRFNGNTFKSDGVAELIIQDGSDNLIRRDPQTTFIATATNDFVINFDETKEHPCTCEAFADHRFDEHHQRNTDESSTAFNTPARRKAILSITFNTPFEFDFPNYGQYCQGLFFDPYLHVLRTTPYDITWTDEETENLILCVNDMIWHWPEENQRISLVYTRVRVNNLDRPPFFEFPDGWEDCHNECVFNDVACNLMPCEVNSILYLPLQIRMEP